MRTYSLNVMLLLNIVSRRYMYMYVHVHVSQSQSHASGSHVLAVVSSLHATVKCDEQISPVISLLQYETPHDDAQSGALTHLGCVNAPGCVNATTQVR